MDRKKRILKEEIAFQAFILSYWALSVFDYGERFQKN